VVEEERSQGGTLVKGSSVPNLVAVKLVRVSSPAIGA
jgi:hypothetical protein